MNISAFGDGSMAAGGNIWIGRFRRLAHAVQQHGAFMDSLLSGAIAERPLLASAVDAFVAGRDSGFLLIQAEAGFGKTHFAARLAREHRLPVHFCQLGAADAQTAAAVGSLAAQTIATWKLDELAPNGVLPPDAEDPNWLGSVLRAAAERRSGLLAKSGQGDVPPVMLVVDGLDAAAERPAGLPPLGLPQDLPGGVYIVATARTGGLPWRPPRKLGQAVTFSGDQRENIDDLRAHLAALADAEPLASALSRTGTGAREFTDILADRSQGVWVYVQYVLEALKENPDDTLAELPGLPTGLDDYYDIALEQFADGDQGRDMLRLLAALAALAEPADPPTIAELAGVGDDFTERQLRHRLRPFCATVAPTTPGGLRRFGLRHDSLREFLSQPPAEEHALREQTATLVHRTQHQICDHYLTLWGGLDQGLPALAADPELARVHREYGLRALPAQLRLAGREPQLHQLLRCSEDGTNIWYAAHDRAGTIGAYLTEVERLRRDAPTVAQEVRYRLIEASITSLSSTCPPAVLGELVARGTWTGDRALSHIERMTDEERQARALVRMLDDHPDLPEHLVARASTVAAGITDEDHRATGLAAVLPRVPEDLLDTAARAVFSLQGQAKATPLMVALALRWPASRIAELLGHDALRRRGDDYICLTAAVELASRRFQACIATARRMRNGYERCRLVQALVPHLPPDAFDEVLSLLRTDPKYADDTLVQLARTVPARRLAELCEFAIDTVRATGATRAALVSELAARYTPDLLPPILGLAGGAGGFAGEAVAAAAPRLGAAEARALWFELTDRAGRLTIGDGEQRSLAMAALAARLPESEGRAAVAATVRRLSGEPESRLRERELVPFWRWLDEPVCDRVLSALCRSMTWTAEYARVGAGFLGLIASELDGRQVEAAFEMVLRESAWHPESRLVVADVLAFRLDDRQLERARQACMTFPLEEQAFSALAHLAGTEPPGPERDHLAREALTMASSVHHARHRGRAAAALAPLLGPELADEAFELVVRVGHPGWLAHSLEQLAPALTGPQILRGLDSIKGPWDRSPHGMPRCFARLEEVGETDGLLERFHGLVDSGSQDVYGLARCLLPEQAETAWPRAAEGLEGNDRAAVLAVLANRLPPAHRPAAVDEALSTVELDRISLDTSYAIPTARILPDLARAAVTDRLVLVYREFITRHMTSRIDLWLEHLVPDIPDEALEDAFRRATSSGWRDYDARALAQLAPCLSGPLLQRALDHVSAPPAGDHVDCAKALAALAPQVSADTRGAVLGLALEFARRIPWNAHIDGTYLALIPQLEGEQRKEAVGHSLRLGRPVDWPRFTALLSVLDTAELEHVYDEVCASSPPETRATAQAHIMRAAAAEEHSRAFFAGDRPLQRDWPPELDRAALFDLIAASAWYIRRQGGRKEVRALTDAVLDVIRWWP